MKMELKLLVLAALSLPLALSCSKTESEDSGTSGGGSDKKEVVITGAAEITANTAVVYCFLNLETDVRSTSKFGILYSTNENPTKDNGTLVYSNELDSDSRFAVTIKGLSYSTKYYYKAFVKYESGSFQYGKAAFFTTEQSTVPEIVDLGLSVKWRSWNLGASKPEEYGGYYQWAGTKDVTDESIYLDWSNCPCCVDKEGYKWIKYIPSDKSSYWSKSGNPDNKSVLDLSDDVANVKLGGKWRMPTSEEWKELMDNCTWTWTSDYKGTGVAGRIVTSNKSGYTDKSIFLPAASFRYRYNLYDVGSFGDYWSSSLRTDCPYYAYLVNFDADDVNEAGGYRYFGQSVRPVQEF